MALYLKVLNLNNQQVEHEEVENKEVFQLETLI